MYCQQGSNFLKGALLGSVVAGIASLLVAPKSGRELRNSFAEGYNSVGQKTRDLTDDLITRGRNLINREEVEEHLENEAFHSLSPLVAGIIVGGIVGATAALLLAPDSGEHLRKALGSHYNEIRDKAEEFVSGVNTKGHAALEQVEDWKETFSNLISKLGNRGKNRSCGSQLDEILEWASLGVRAIQQLQKRS